jgi:hypothetical protein
MIRFANGTAAVRRAKIIMFSLCVGAMLVFQGCNASMKNRVLGRSWTYMGGHEVVIAPCYWPSRKSAGNITDATPNATYQFTCGQTEVVIKNEELFVNGKSYGVLHKGERVGVERGLIRINADEIAKVARN